MTAQTPAQRQADRRARMTMLGMTEVRGIFLPPELHKVLKDHALKLLALDMAGKIKPEDKK